MFMSGSHECAYSVAATGIVLCQILGVAGSHKNNWSRAAHVVFLWQQKKTLKNISWNKKIDDIIAPIVEKSFTIVLQQVGPQWYYQGGHGELTAAQTRVAADIEETLQMFSQRSNVPHPFRGAMTESKLLARDSYSG